MKQLKGFSLIELIIFLVVIGIAATTVLSSMDIILKTTHTNQENGVAVHIASRCLEWYLGQNQMHGYESVICPETTVPSFCSVPSGFSISVNVACTTLYNEPTSHYKTVTATVSGKGSATLSLLLADDEL